MAGAAPASGIRDNYSRGSVGDFLREKIRDGSSMSVVSAYFTIYAFDALREELEKIDCMRFLFGEPRFIGSIDPDRTDKKAFKIEDEGLTLANRLEQKRWRATAPHGFLLRRRFVPCARPTCSTARCTTSQKMALRTRSSEARTSLCAALALAASNNNIELNLEVDSNRDRRDLRDWFDEIWNDNSLAEDVNQEVLHYLGQLYANNAPEFIYFKTLFHIFERFLAAQNAGGLLFRNTQIVETEIWRTLFEFQKDGVKGAINKINAHNGCILADSVGLGKTFEALAVIKYFELRNHHVLVLCPKKLRENWTIYQAQNNSELNPFVRDRFAYTVLSHTDLSRESGRSGDIDLGSMNWGNYDLVVIDESHNFGITREVGAMNKET